MRARTGIALAGIVVALLGAAAIGFTGVLGSDSGPDGELTVRWTSDTARSIQGNHHAPAVGQVGTREVVFAPISGRRNTAECALLALRAANGSKLWRYSVPPGNCTLHSVADPTVADYDGDGSREVLATTTEEVVVAFDPRTGTEELRANLSDYGYTRPIVADLVGDGGNEIVVVDVRGTVFALRSNGTTAWRTDLSAYTNAQPVVADFDADGSSEVAVGLVGNGSLYLLDGDGSRQWKSTAPLSSSITWMTTGRADSDDAIETVVATDSGTVAAVDGASGEIEWRRDVGEFAAVHAFGDGDRDGSPEIYAVAADGVLRALDASDGSVDWETTLTGADVPMTPPPSLGDVDGDNAPEIVAVTNDGRVSVIGPESGAVLATYEREGEVPIYTHPTLADTNGDGAVEIYVLYGDGRVVSLAYEERE
jgi:outer membrane protein assembly factor BamB